MKIIDAFVFYNELDLLEIRLEVLNEVVDYFVLVEATRTFQNNKKPLYFEENKSRFVKYIDKIVHVVVDDMPSSDEPFELESHQRNAISRGFRNFSANDQVIISDVDEIPDPDAIRRVQHKSGLRLFRQPLYYYFVNCACIELDSLPWSAMCNLSEASSPQTIRDVLVDTQGRLLSGLDQENKDISLIENGGWHFSYLGGVEAIKEKIKAFSHDEYNSQEYLDDASILKAITEGADLFGREYHFKYVPLDSRFPVYLLKHKERYSRFIKGLE